MKPAKASKWGFKIQTSQNPAMYNIIYSILKYILAVIVLKPLTKETYQIKTKYGRMEAHKLLLFTSWVGAYHFLHYRQQ